MIDEIEEKPDLIVLDPPRDGIHPKALDKIWMEYNLYYYDSILDAVVMKDKDDNELVIECAKANAQVVFDEPEDEGYLVRLAREEPANYMSYVLKPDGLQGYVDAMNVFN